MKPKVFMLLGDGGYITSPGFSGFGDDLAREGYEIAKYDDSGRNSDKVVWDIWHHAGSTAIFGYSLGAWYAPLIGKKLNQYKRNVDLIIGWDPARKNSEPVTSNVKRCICFKQSFPWSPMDWIFGGGSYTAATYPRGPNIETIKIYDDHVLIQWNESLRHIARDALTKLVA